MTMRPKRDVRSGLWRRARGKGPRGFIFVLSLGALTGCDLEVSAPAAITEESLQDPAAAELLVNSALAHFECGYSAFTYEESGRADTWDRLAGAHSGNAMEHSQSAGTGTCSTAAGGYVWFTPIMIARSIASDAYNRMSGWTDQQVPNRERLMATAAVYLGASIGLYGEFHCEFALDGGPLMTQMETLELAEDWMDKALGHIQTTGDFALTHGATTSIRTLAYGLRARIRWAQGETRWADALSDALQVPQGYMAWVTRDAGPLRRNVMYHAGTLNGFGHVLGPITHWEGPPNPVTGQEWPNPLPFSGYLQLGILPDGRAISDAQKPIRTTDFPNAVPDTRVTTRVQPVQGPAPGPVPTKYRADADDHPLLGWNDIWLIRAEIEGGQAAIDRVNELRRARNLPVVTYANPANADQILDMIIEERRRDLWLEGRFWSTKIQHTDRLWFPRRAGNSLFQGYAYQGGVALAMSNDEYDLNPNFDQSDRATGCESGRRPILAD
jgi:hypothetical protein